MTKAKHSKEYNEDLSADLAAMEADAAPANIEGETRNEAFLRLMNKRLPVAVKRLRLIGNLSSSNYDYTSEQVAQVMAVLEMEVKRIEDAFNKENVEDDIPTIG